MTCNVWKVIRMVERVIKVGFSGLCWCDVTIVEMVDWLKVNGVIKMMA